MKKFKSKFFLVFFCFVLFSVLRFIPSDNSSLISPLSKNVQKEYEVFGFAPYWNMDKMDNINFNVLTTLAYFDIPIDGNGKMQTYSSGYRTFNSRKATELFKKAHANGTRVAVTLTQMNNYDINSLIKNTDAQNQLISDVINLVKERGIDGVNIDFEYIGNPGYEYRNKFTYFVQNLTESMHKEVPGSRVTVSVYASAVKDPKIYDIEQLSKVTDGIFMMAYDFAVTNSQNAIPTSPLYGHKEGKYWYDISSAVDDFLSVMPSKKLILGLPWYGYNYPVYNPEVMAQTQQSYWRSNAWSQTYADVQNYINPVLTGWDNLGKVGWEAYILNGVWRMIFFEDTKSLKIKYDYAKQKNLGGVGMWAMGNDYGRDEFWNLLQDQFGVKLTDNRIINKKITGNI